jgi:hypothetical protein
MVQRTRGLRVVWQGEFGGGCAIILDYRIKSDNDG